MSFLSGKTIRELIEQNVIYVENYGVYDEFLQAEELDRQIQPASIDLTLGNSFRKQKPQVMRLGRKPVKYSHEIRVSRGKAFLLMPKSFVLATTREIVGIPENMAAMVANRSSIGRTGLFIENAGWVDPGFRGQITLELYNASWWPMYIYPDQRICQMVFGYLDQEADAYSGKYGGQMGATGSQVHEDQEWSSD